MSQRSSVGGRCIYVLLLFCVGRSFDIGDVKSWIVCKRLQKILPCAGSFVDMITSVVYPVCATHHSYNNLIGSQHLKEEATATRSWMVWACGFTIKSSSYLNELCPGEGLDSRELFICDSCGRHVLVQDHGRCCTVRYTSVMGRHEHIRETSNYRLLLHGARAHPTPTRRFFYQETLLRKRNLITIVNDRKPIRMSTKCVSRPVTPEKISSTHEYVSADRICRITVDSKMWCHLQKRLLTTLRCRPLYCLIMVKLPSLPEI